jgi:hypothetical protein
MTYRIFVYGMSGSDNVNFRLGKLFAFAVLKYNCFRLQAKCVSLPDTACCTQSSVNARAVTTIRSFLATTKYSLFVNTQMVVFSIYSAKPWLIT